jgi:hypothetical protein
MPSAGQAICSTAIFVGHGIVAPDRINRTLPGQRPSWTNNQGKFNQNSWPLQGFPTGLQASSVHSIAVVAISVGGSINS